MLELVFSSTNCSSILEEEFVQILLCWSLQGWGEFLTLTLGLMILELVFSSTNRSSIFEEEFVQILLCWSLQGWGCQIAEEHKNAASNSLLCSTESPAPLFIISDSRSCKLVGLSHTPWEITSPLCPSSQIQDPETFVGLSHIPWDESPRVLSLRLQLVSPSEGCLFHLGYSPLLHQANAQIAHLVVFWSKQKGSPISFLCFYAIILLHQCPP